MSILESATADSTITSEIFSVSGICGLSEHKAIERGQLRGAMPRAITYHRPMLNFPRSPTRPPQGFIELDEIGTFLQQRSQVAVASGRSGAAVEHCDKAHDPGPVGASGKREDPFIGCHGITQSSAYVRVVVQRTERILDFLQRSKHGFAVCEGTRRIAHVTA